MARLVASTASQNGMVTPTRGMTATIHPRTRFVLFSGASGGASAVLADGSNRMACMARNMHTAQLETHRA